MSPHSPQSMLNEIKSELVDKVMNAYQIPMCLVCKHYRKAQRCDAFPKRIPQGILTSKFDHRKPFQGDNEIRFEPREDASKDEIKRILSVFDNGH